MTERELGRALLNVDAGSLLGGPDGRMLTWKVLERDRRRVRWLTGLTVAVWLLAAGLVLTALVGFGLLFPREAKLLRDIEEGKVPPAQQEQALRTHLIGFQKGTLVMTFSVAVLCGAALCTLLLLFFSRRATLRQLNAGLLEVAEQLKRLQPPPPSGRG
jgi:hypothetical protein